MPILLRTHEGKTILLQGPFEDSGQTLAQATWLSGAVSPPPLCSGMGRCLGCKVRFITPPPPALPVEHSLLGPAVAEGWRLACRHGAHKLGDAEILLPPPPRPEFILTGTPPPAHGLLLAVDLGTTSVHWCALDAGGQVYAEGQQLNPQMGAGADVMSRLAQAGRPGGLARLSALTLAALRDIADQLPPLRELCVAGNTAMTAILLQKDIASLAAAPYALPLSGHSQERLPGLPPLYIPPQPAPFVGGDISAGYATLPQKPEDFPFLLADLGTNGEFVLALDPQHALLASVPMGPSLEGIGLSFGDMADTMPGKGIVHRVELGPQGLVPHTLAGGSPGRLCATGYLSLVHALLRGDLLRADGSFNPSPSAPFLRKVAARLHTQDGELRLPLWGDVYLSGFDVEEILKVKAAFSLAVQHLLQAASLPAREVRHIWLAGAMGSHIRPGDMEALGFLPPGMSLRLTPVGNASLQGAKLLLLEPKLRNDLAVWSQGSTVLPLAEQPDFITNYTQHMRFAYPD